MFEKLLFTFSQHEGAEGVAQTLAMESLPEEYLISYLFCYNFANLQHLGCLNYWRRDRMYFGPKHSRRV